MLYKIVYTDNFCRDHIDEYFINLPPMPKEAAIRIIELLVKYCTSSTSPDWWKIVPCDYKLKCFIP